jgi:hypothetical protein
MSSSAARVELQLVDQRLHPPVSLPPIAADGSVQAVANSAENWIVPVIPPLASIRTLSAPRIVDWGGCRIRVTPDPLAIVLTDAAGRPCQRMRINPNGEIHFARGNGPIFGLGQGGHQFDRRGGSFPLVNGQGEGVHSVDMRDPARAHGLRIRPGA